MVRVCFVRRNTLIYEEFTINRLIVYLIASPLKRFLILFFLTAKDLYNDGARGGDGSDCLTLCDICMLLTRSVGCDCEGSPIAIISIRNVCKFVYTIIMNLS